MDVDPADPRQNHVRRVLHPDRAGREPARQPSLASRFKPGKPDPRPAPLPRPAIRPLLQPAGQRIQPRTVSLLRILRPPRRQLTLVQIPPAPQGRQRPRNLRQQITGNPVRTFRIPLVQAPAHLRQRLVKRLARRTTMRGQRPHLRRRRVQRKPKRLQHHSRRRIKMLHAKARHPFSELHDTD